MNIKLLTERHLWLIDFKAGCTGSSESTLVKMPHCWKSHVTAQLLSKDTSCMMPALGHIGKLVRSMAQNIFCVETIMIHVF